MMKKINSIVSVLALVFVLAACHKDDAPNVDNTPVVKGLYVLNEGSFFGNNTTITKYDLNSGAASTDFYASVNGSGLGDTGNDMLVYGSKVYIVMNVSSYVRVADATTMTSIREIPFETSAGAVDRQPRYAVPYKNKVLVSSYDGTVAVIDTTSLAIDRFITVGTNPEQMVIVDNNLYVANSGGLSAVFDSTVSVIDLATFTETRKITVGVNPGSITADNAGNLYVGCSGDYADVHGSLVKVSTQTGSILKSADTTVGKIRFYDGKLFVTGGYYGQPYVRTLNTEDFAQSGANFVSDGTVITTPYGLNVDPLTGDVYVGDAKDFQSSGSLFCFDKTGKKKFSFSTAPGLSPNTTVIIR